MKRRHRMLKMPIMFSGQGQQDLIFRTCGIKHNMLLQYNEMDNIGENEEDWELITDMADLSEPVDDHPDRLSQHAVHEEVLAENKRTKMTAIDQLILQPAATPVSVSTDMGIVGCKPLSDEQVEEERGYTDRQAINC